MPRQSAAFVRVSGRRQRSYFKLLQIIVYALVAKLFIAARLTLHVGDNRG